MSNKQEHKKWIKIFIAKLTSAVSKTLPFYAGIIWFVNVDVFKQLSTQYSFFQLFENLKEEAASKTKIKSKLFQFFF